ncbi:MAG: CPCC family cysteine-rich protein [Oscillospiraceae bacterium]
MKYVCKCCGNAAMNSADEYDICPVCFWERDFYQEKNPDSSDGANKVSLNEAKRNYAEFGACEKRFMLNVRKADVSEKLTTMRRNDRREDEKFAFEVFDKADHAVISMIDEDGQPYCIPISAVRMGEAVYFHSAECGRKTAAMLKNPNVCMTAAADVQSAEDKFTTYFKSAVIRGKAVLVNDDEEKIAALKAICEHFTPSNMSDFENAVKASLSRTAVWKILVESATGKQKKKK